MMKKQTEMEDISAERIAYMEAFAPKAWGPDALREEEVSKLSEGEQALWATWPSFGRSTDERKGHLRMLVQEALYFRDASARWHRDNPRYLHETLIGLIPYLGLEHGPFAKLVLDQNRKYQVQEGVSVQSAVVPS